MKKKILVPIMALAIAVTSINYNSTGKNIMNSTSLSSLLSLNIASAEGTGQNGKFTKHKTESLKIWVQVDASGNILKVVTAGVSGAIEKTITEEWDCCASGGNGCSSNNPSC